MTNDVVCTIGIHLGLRNRRRQSLCPSSCNIIKCECITKLDMKLTPISKPISTKVSTLEKPKFIHAKYFGDRYCHVVLGRYSTCTFGDPGAQYTILCHPLENDAMQIKTALLVLRLAWQNESRPCLLIVANPSSTEDGLEVSVGGVIRE